jgi:hypothetical protein
VGPGAHTRQLVEEACATFERAARSATRAFLTTRNVIGVAGDRSPVMEISRVERERVIQVPNETALGAPIQAPTWCLASDPRPLTKIVAPAP